MVADETQAVDRVSLLGDAERHRLLVEWNATEADYPGDSCIHELFEAQVDRTPDAIAVVHEDRELSYGELNARANRLAHHLRALGVKPDDRVAICVERSCEMLVGILAVLKAGGGYVPLDPSYPVERLGYMLDDSAPAVLLTQSGLRDALEAGAAGLPVVELDGDASLWGAEPDTNPDPAVVGLNSTHLAYVIYTSGSTGKPKGVMVEHANVTRLFSATEAWFQFGRSDVWPLFHSFAFDFSVWEIWGALSYGGRLVVVPGMTTRSPGDFYALLCRAGITVLNQTPSAFRQLIAAQKESTEQHRLRHVIFGGEALEIRMLEPWRRDGRNRQTRLINMYGITETTVHVTYCALGGRDWERPGTSPIGRRIPDMQVYLLDQHGEPVPVGVAGEIHIGGGGVARGYLHRPDLTSERFIASPFVAGDRLYRTGDLGRYRPDGTIEYLGRNDHQVKIRGFRIELGEIEVRLSSCPGVGDAVVLAREDAPGETRLVAYYTLAQDGAGVEVDALRGHLCSALPDYMVPAAYVRLASFPLTANGKTDRKALPAPEGDAYARGAGYEAPVGEIEETLASIWSDVLGHERVGRHDNFFELGGHSLLAVKLLDRMRQAGLHAQVRDLFGQPTVASLALATKQLKEIEL